MKLFLLLFATLTFAMDIKLGEKVLLKNSCEGNMALNDNLFKIDCLKPINGIISLECIYGKSVICISEQKNYILRGAISAFESKIEMRSPYFELIEFEYVK